MRCLIVLAAVVAVASAAAVGIPSKCQMPQQWEAQLVMFSPERYGNSSDTYHLYGRYSYDGINQRKFIVEQLYTGASSQAELHMILELYQTNKAYVTNLQTKQCKIYDIDPKTRPFLRHDIPVNARFDGLMLLGSYPDQLELSQWTWSDSQGFFHYGTWTDNCVPVRDDAFGNQATGGMFNYQQFSDVTVGFHDPNIFIPPSNCYPADEE